MFSIRGISLAESLPLGESTSVTDVLGAEFVFRKGVSIALTLPPDPQAFTCLGENAPRVLSALTGWARVYRYPENNGYAIHVLATAEEATGDIEFYRLDFWQRRKLRGPKPPVEIRAGEIINRDQCVRWLVDLADTRARDPQFTALVRCPIPRIVPDVRLAWIGPDITDKRSMSERLFAIGQVYEAVIVHVSPKSFSHVQAQLSLATPLHTVIICSHFAPYINTAAVPDQVPANLIHECNSSNRADLEQQIATWLDMVIPEIRNVQFAAVPASEDQLLLSVILQGMLSHSKIGPNNHCQKETVLKRIRARHLDTAAAERILDENSERYESTKQSDCLFLWKDHNDGRQYFLNPKTVPDIRAMVGEMPGSSASA
jgi:hypothetical protein